MLLTYLQNKFANASKVAAYAALAFMLVSMPTYAQNIDLSGVTAQSMLVNIADSIPNLMRLITAIAYVLGILMIVRGVVKLKHVGESRTMMSQEHSLSGPIAQITVGALLLYLPSTVQVGMSSFWNSPNPYGYTEQQDQWSQFINVCYLIVQFIGTLAFIRGLVILSHIGTHGQQGQVSRGITHIVGGIFCINIYQFLQVIFNTLGVNQ